MRQMTIIINVESVGASKDNDRTRFQNSVTVLSSKDVSFRQDSTWCLSVMKQSGKVVMTTLSQNNN
jgi:hypothetical protein